MEGYFQLVFHAIIGMGSSIIRTDNGRMNKGWRTEMVASCLPAKVLEASRECR